MNKHMLFILKLISIGLTALFVLTVLWDFSHLDPANSAPFSVFLMMRAATFLFPAALIGVILHCINKSKK